MQPPAIRSVRELLEKLQIPRARLDERCLDIIGSARAKWQAEQTTPVVPEVLVGALPLPSHAFLRPQAIYRKLNFYGKPHENVLDFRYFISTILLRWSHLGCMAVRQHSCE